MKRTTYLVILLLIVSRFACEAQISGYCGKRHSIRYDNFCRPVYSNLIDETDPAQGFSIRARHALSYEFVSGRQTVLGLSLQTYQFTPGVQGDIRANDGELYNISGPISLHGTDVALYVKSFNSDWIAPLGKYFRYGLMISHISVPSTDNLTISAENGNLYSSDFNEYLASANMTTVTVEPVSFTTITPIVGFGTQRVYFDRVLLDLGLEFGFPLRGFTSLFKRDISEPLQSVDSLEKMAGRRMFRAHLMSFCIGIGFLL